MRRERERGGGRREEKRVRCRTPVQPARGWGTVRDIPANRMNVSQMKRY